MSLGKAVVTGAGIGSATGYILGFGNPGGAVTGAIWGGAVGVTINMAKKISPLAIGAILGGAAGAVLVGVPAISALISIPIWGQSHMSVAEYITGTLVWSAVPAGIGSIVGATIAKISSIATRERIH